MVAIQQNNFSNPSNIPIHVRDVPLVAAPVSYKREYYTNFSVPSQYAASLSTASYATTNSATPFNRVPNYVPASYLQPPVASIVNQFWDVPQVSAPFNRVPNYVPSSYLAPPAASIISQFWDIPQVAAPFNRVPNYVPPSYIVPSFALSYFAHMLYELNR